MLKLELPEQMVMVIADALGNYRFKDAAPVIAEIQRQMQAQAQAQPQPIKQPHGNGQELPARQ